MTVYLFCRWSGILYENSMSELWTCVCVMCVSLSISLSSPPHKKWSAEEFMQLRWYLTSRHHLVCVYKRWVQQTNTTAIAGHRNERKRYKFSAALYKHTSFITEMIPTSLRTPCSNSIFERIFSNQILVFRWITASSNEDNSIFVRKTVNWNRQKEDRIIASDWWTNQISRTEENTSIGQS